MFGLSKEIYEKIKNIIEKYDCNFILFGSRARGDYKTNSDIDIAIENVKEEDMYKIQNEFDLLDTPYTFDLVFIKESTKNELLISIKREGVKL